MLSRTALLLLGLAAVSMATQSTFTVVSAPSSVRFDKDAGALPLESVGKALSASLGLNSDLSWPGLIAGSPFENPQASVVVVVDAAAGVPSGVAQFPLSHTEASFATLAAHLVASHAGAFAPVLSKAFSAASNILSASASKEVSFIAQGHSLHWDSAAMTFKDSAKTFSLTEAQVADLFAQSTLADVSFDEVSKTFTVKLANGRTAQLSLAAFSSFFHEVFGMLEVAARFAASAKASSSPSSLTLALSSLPSALASAASESERQAIQKVTASFIAALTFKMNEAFANQVVIATASVVGTQDAFSAHVRVARDVSALAAVNPQAAGKYKPNQAAFVEYCSNYRCFCRSAGGKPFDINTGCVKDCTAEEVCPCVYYGCACNSTDVIDSSSECIQCAPGYVLRGNSCFVDNGWVVQFNMVLVLGLLAVLSLFATCYAIGNMDPGRNSVIYRMTSGRLKTQ